MNNENQNTASAEVELAELRRQLKEANETTVQQALRLQRQVRSINQLKSCIARMKLLVSNEADEAMKTLRLENRNLKEEIGSLTASFNNFREENILLRHETASYFAEHHQLHDRIIELEKRLKERQSYVDWLLNERTLLQRIRNDR